MKLEVDESGAWLSLGFSVVTTDEGTIKDNARDRACYDGILKRGVTKSGEITDKGWEYINADIPEMEKRFLAELSRVSGMTFREEGHDRHGDLVGSCWVDLNEHPEALAFIFSHANDANMEPYSEPHEITGMKLETVYHKVHPVTLHSVDISFGFIDVSRDEAELLLEAKELPIAEAIEILKPIGVLA